MRTWAYTAAAGRATGAGVGRRWMHCSSAQSDLSRSVVVIVVVVGVASAVFRAAVNSCVPVGSVCLSLDVITATVPN